LQWCKIVNFATLIVASTIVGRGFPGTGHVPRHGIVRYRRIVDMRSLFTVLAGDMYQGDPHKAPQPIQGHPLGTEIAEKLHLERRHPPMAM